MLLLVVLLHSVSAQEGPGEHGFDKRFFWPWPVTQRCWAAGTTPNLQLDLPGLLLAEQAAQSYAVDPSQLYDGRWTNMVNRDNGADAIIRLKVMRERLQGGCWTPRLIET